MTELWYPPYFSQWPAAARGAWYAVNSTKHRTVRELRDADGVEFEVGPNEYIVLNRAEEDSDGAE